MSALTHERCLYELCPPPTQWTPSTCRVRCPRRLTKRTPHVAPERRPDADTSVVPAGSPAPVPVGKPAVPSAVSACRRFPEPAHRPCPDPERLSSGLAASRKTTSEAFPEERPSCRLCSDPGIRFAGYPDHHRSQHSAAENRNLPHHPRSGLLPQSRRRDVTAGDRSADSEKPVLLPTKNPYGMLPHLAPRRFKCTAFV